MAPSLSADTPETSPFYIESVVSFAQRRTRTLKSGYTFALFDGRGDIVPGEGNSDGIYLHDTRFLSQLELRLNGAPLLLLSSNVQEDNAVLAVDLANSDFTSRHDTEGLHAELIHINRLKYIWQNTYYERLLVHNFDTKRHSARLSLSFGADFADIFEVRGRRRSRRGQVSAALLSDASAELRYLGLDGGRAGYTPRIRAGTHPTRRRGSFV
jgi:glycogen debranching enzyme